MKKRNIIFVIAFFMMILGLASCNNNESKANESKSEDIFEKNKYTIIWKNYDGVVLEEDKEVEYGTVPSYDGKTPSKPSTAQYTYTFNNWDSEVTTVTGDKVYTAQFIETINKYTITWKNDDGSVINTTEVEYGKMPTHRNPTKANNDEYTYEFRGWTPEVTSVTGEATYTATYSSEKNKYRYIFYDEDGASQFKNETINYGEQIIPPAEPTKASTAKYTYTFDGWYTAFEGGIKVNDFSTITENVKYYARYNSFINKYSITWKDDDESLIDITEEEYGKKPTHNDPIKTGNDEYSYEFNGWTPDITSVIGDVTYKATYVKYIKYTFIYKDYHSIEIKIKENDNINDFFPKNTNTTIIDNKKYTYVGWSKIDNYTYSEIENVIQLYEITYNLDGGINSKSNVKLVEEGDNLYLSEASKKGFTFDGWYLDDSFSSSITKIENISSNYNLYAKFSIIFYSINYELFEGTNNIKNPIQFTIEDSIILQPATKKGYAFIGWYTDLSYCNKIENIEYLEGDLLLYANYEENYYDIYLDSSNGVLEEKYFNIRIIDYYDTSLKTLCTKDFYVQNGKSFDAYSWITKKYEHHTEYVHLREVVYYSHFSGLYYDSSFEELFIGETLINRDIILYAKWYVTSNFTFLSSYSLKSFQSYTGLSDDKFIMPYEYKNFEVNCVGYYDCGDTTYGNNGKMYAKVYISVNGIIKGSFYGTNGSLLIEAKPGDLIVVSKKVVDDGHMWPASHLSYSIRVKDKNDTTCMASNTNIIENIKYNSIPDFPKYYKTGYDFVGWEYKGKIIDSSQPWSIDENITLLAIWKLTNYSINYDLNGGINSAENPDSYDISSNISLGSASKLGYDFIGWYEDANFNISISNINNRTGNIVLFAKFKKSTYSYIIDANGGTFNPKVTFVSDGMVINTQYIGDSDSLIYIEPFDKNNFIFGGWYLDDNFINAYDFSSNIVDDVVLYAKWYLIEDSQKIETNENLIENISVDGKNYVKMAFVPMKDGSIAFTSSSLIDTIAYLYDSNMNLLTSNNDISDEDFNFSISYSFTKNHLYYLKFKAEQTSASGILNLIVSSLSEPSSNGKGNTYSTYTRTIIYEDDFELPIPTKEGLEFVGWFDENNNQVYSGKWNYTSDMTIYAKWE